MLQNRVVSSSLSATVTPELAESLDHTLANERLQVIKRTFSLPDSLQSFLLFLLFLSLFCGALFAHLLLSTTIHQSELHLAELKQVNQAITRESTVLIEQIALESSLESGLARINEQGYTVAYDRRYISQPRHLQTGYAKTQSEGVPEANWDQQPASVDAMQNHE